MSSLQPLNASRILGVAYLHVAAGTSTSHLAPEVAGDRQHARSILDGIAANLDRYDPAALAEVRWSPVTACGRPWLAMLSDEDEEVNAEEADLAERSSHWCPSCVRAID